MSLAPNFRLDGATALVTGASAGTGLAISLALARAGAALLMIARDAAALEAAAATVRQAGGVAEVQACDVTDSAAVRRLVAAMPRLDILVNNAGTNVPAPFAEVTDDQLDQLIALNMRATFVVAQAAIAKMLSGAVPDVSHVPDLPCGSVINIGSQMGHVGAAHRTVYCMTKHAVEGLTKAMAIEFAPQRIRVNSIAPTFVDTPLIRRIVDTEAKHAQLLSRIPLGRMAVVEDVAAAVVYLASPAAAMVTGSCLRVDGGWTAQ